MKAWQAPRGAQNGLRSSRLRAPRGARSSPGHEEGSAAPRRSEEAPGAPARRPRSPAAEEPRRAPRGLSAAAQGAAPGREVAALRPLFLEGLPAVLSGQGAAGRGCQPGADARAARGGEKRVPRTEVTAQSRGKGPRPRERLQCADPAGARAAPAGAPSLAWIRGGPGERRANPHGLPGGRHVTEGVPRGSAGGRGRSRGGWLPHRVKPRAPGRLPPHGRTRRATSHLPSRLRRTAKASDWAPTGRAPPPRL